MMFLDWQIDGGNILGVQSTFKNQLVANSKLGGGSTRFFEMTQNVAPLPSYSCFSHLDDLGSII